MSKPRHPRTADHPDRAPRPPAPPTHSPAHDVDEAECLTGYVEQAGTRILTADQIRAWCGRPDVTIVVKPVIDLHDRLETAGYRPTDRIRDHVIARDRTCAFPWCGRNARRCDLDHVIPYDHDDPDRGGTTSTDNLAPLCRTHHRLKTRGRWRYAMTNPGVFVWTSPHGHEYLRDHTGSRPVHRTDSAGATATHQTSNHQRPTPRTPERTRGHRHVHVYPRPRAPGPNSRDQGRVSTRIRPESLPSIR